MSLKTQIESLATRTATEFKTVKSEISGNTSGDLSGLTTTVKTSILAAINELVTAIAGKQASLGFTPENIANKGAANGYAELDGTGKVPAAQLPGFVDDIQEFANMAAFPAVGESGLLYVALDTNMTYRWTGTAYVAMNGALALGETSATAYRGDRGKTAYDHSQTAHDYAASGHTHDDRYFTETEIGDITTDFVATFEAGLL